MATEAKGSGAKLASGYIELTVRYASALSKIAKDFDEIEAKAATSGKNAGILAGKELKGGIEAGVAEGGANAAKKLDEAGIDMTRRANGIGAAVGHALGRGISAPISGLTSVAEKSFQGLSKSGVRLRQRMGKSFEDMSEDAGKSLGKIVPMGGAAERAIGAIAPEALIAVAGIGTLVGGFGLLLESGEKWENISKGLQFKTGLGGEDLEGLTNMITQASKEVPVSSGKIAGVAGALQTSLHLTGDSLKTTAEQISIFQQKSGEQVDIAGLGTIKRALGTDAKDIPALLDQLYTAGTKTGVPMNDLIGTLAKTAPLMKQFGMDAGQSAGLLTQFDEAGIDVNKVVPSLARAFKESAKAGETMQQYIGENVDKIKALHAAGDDIGSSNLANNVFGGGLRGGAAAWLTAIQNGTLDLQNLAPQGPQQSILDNAKKSETMDEQFTGIKNNLDAALKPYGEALMKNLSGWVATASSWFEKNAPQIIGAIGHAFSNVGHAFDNVGHAMDNVGHAWDNFMHAMDNVGHALDNVQHAYDNIWHASDNIWHAFDNVGHAIGNVIHFFDVLPSKVESFFAGLPDKIGSFFSTAADKIVGFFSSAVDKITGFFSNLPDKIGNFFSNLHIPGFAGGGPLDSAPGPVGRDSALFWGAKGEHVFTADEVNKMGGHAGVFAFRRALHRDEGGPVGPDVQAAYSLDGTPYSQGSRDDCSGMVARVVNGAMGLPDDSLPSTQNMRNWLAARGFKEGIGGPGAISVGWYNHGSALNDGHAAMTLSNGQNAESGGSHGNFLIGAGAAGASSSEFDQHMYLPATALFGEGSPFGGAGSPFGGASGGMGGIGGGGIPAGSTPGVNAKGEQGYYTPDAKKVEGANAKIDRLNQDIAKLDDKEKKAKKQSERDKIDQEIDKKKGELAKAQDELTKAEQGDFHKSKGDKEKSPFGDLSRKDMAPLGDIASKGITDSLLPPGFINPFETGAMHIASTLMSFFGGMLGKKDGAPLSIAGAFLSGNGGQVVSALQGLGGPMGGLPGADRRLTSGAPGGDPRSASPFDSNPSGDSRFQVKPPPVTWADSVNKVMGGAPEGSLPILSGLAGHALTPSSPISTGTDLLASKPAFDTSGGQPVVHNWGPNYTGATIGHDPQQHMESVQHDKTATQRSQAFQQQRIGM